MIRDFTNNLGCHSEYSIQVFFTSVGENLMFTLKSSASTEYYHHPHMKIREAIAIAIEQALKDMNND